MNFRKMKKIRIKSSNIKIICAILLLMNLFGYINNKNESKNNNANSENTFVNNRKRKLADENYIIVKYGEEVEYSEGFQNSYRTKLEKIDYNNIIYLKTNSLTISANKEVKLYITSGTRTLANFFNYKHDSNANKIISIDLSNFDSSSVTDFQKAFFGCSSLESLTLSNVKTSNAEYMSYMFSGCSSLQSLDLSSFDANSLIFMTDMFRNCIKLQTVT